MATQIQVLIVRIGNASQGSGVTLSFPTDNILISQNGGGSIVKYLDQDFLTNSTVSALLSAANTSGTSMIQATVLRIDDSIQPTPIQVAFPTSKIQIQESSVSGSSSLIKIGANNYYCSESASTLVTASNAGGGGGGGIESVNSGTDITVDNTDPANPIINYTGSSGGNTIYTGDGSLGGNRIVDLDGNSLEFNSSPGGTFLGIDPTVFTSRLRGADGGAYSELVLTGDIVGEDVSFSIYATDGNDAVFFYGDVLDNSIAYNAATHRFAGSLKVNDSANDLLNIDIPTVTTILAANDGVSNSTINLQAETDNYVGFDIVSIKGSNQVQVTGDTAAGTIQIIGYGGGDPTQILINATTETITITAAATNIVGSIQTGGQATFTGTLADAITGAKSVVNGLIID